MMRGRHGLSTTCGTLDRTIGGSEAMAAQPSPRYFMLVIALALAALIAVAASARGTSLDASRAAQDVAGEQSPPVGEPIKRASGASD